MGDTKRRLPLLQPNEDEGEPRPPWQWSVLGGVATLLVLLPLSMLASWYARRTYSAYVPGTTPEEVQGAVRALTGGQRLWLGVLVVVGPIAALAVASFVGGLFVGRFGGDAGKREAAVGASLAAAVAASVAAREMVLQPNGALLWLFTASVLFVVAGVFGYLGGFVGWHRRRRGPSS